MTAGPFDAAFPPPAGGAAGLTVRDLAARYGVAPGTVGTAIRRGAGQGRPAPDPLYTDPVTGARRYHPAAFDRWWRDRPHARTPHRRGPPRKDHHGGRRRVIDVLPDLDDWQPTAPGGVTEMPLPDGEQPTAMAREAAASGQVVHPGRPGSAASRARPGRVSPQALDEG